MYESGGMFLDFSISLDYLVYPFINTHFPSYYSFIIPLSNSTSPLALLFFNDCPNYLQSSDCPCKV